MNDKKKIAFVISELKYSGAAKILTWVANRLALDGYHITIITYLGKDKVYELQPSVKHVSLESNDSNRLVRSYKVVKKLSGLIKQEGYGLLVGFLPVECMYAIIAAKLSKISVVVCERSDPYFEKSIIADIARWIFQFADGAVFQTQGAQAFYPSKLQNKSIIIPNPVIETGEYIPYSERENLITTASRIYIKQKRQDVLLKAFAIVAKSEPTVKLVVVGDGPDEKTIKQLANDLQIADKVVFLGRQKNVSEIIAKSKVFVLTSDYEGIPNALIEALSVGIPSVSTDCSPGGARMILNDNQNGFVVPRENVLQIADRLLWLLHNKQEAENFALEALKIKEKYSQDKIYNLWKNYLEEVLKERKRSEEKN